MNRLPYRQLGGLLVGLGVLSCSFTRFSDLEQDTPVLLLAVPGGFSDTGTTVAALRTKDSSWLYAGASHNFLLYDMGTSDSPSQDAVGRIGCQMSDGCWLGHHVAATIRSGKKKEDLACFAYGINIDRNQNVGIQAYCHDGSRMSLPVPAEVTKVISATKKSSSALTIELAADRDGKDSTLLGALPDSSLVWWYPAGGASARLWVSPVASKKGQGTALAVLQTDDEPLAVVADSSSSSHGRLWILRTPASGSSETLGCIQGDAGFGRVLAPGRFLGTEVDDLAVSDDKQVFVLSQDAILAALSDVKAPEDCVSLEDVDEVLATKCKTQDNWSDCENGQFGDALAPADLDGDDTDELLVGVPAADVRGENAAGVVLVYRIASDKLTITDSLFISSAGSSDRLGQSVVGVPLSRPDVVVAGAPGGNKVATFFCSSLLGDEDRGARCP
jgi:hypothetical protein